MIRVKSLHPTLQYFPLGIYLARAAGIIVDIGSTVGGCSPADVEARVVDAAVAVEVEGGRVLGNGDALRVQVPRQVLPHSIAAVLGQQDEESVIEVFNEKGCYIDVNIGVNGRIDVPDAGGVAAVGGGEVGRCDAA